MTQYVAFLRAINVGSGRTIKMEALRDVFKALGFSNVKSFIASGNIVFETTAKSVKALESKIARRLRKELGYEVVTFIRTKAQVVRMAHYRPFPESKLKSAAEINIILLSDALDKKSKQELRALKSNTDEFRPHGHEIYWLRRKKRGKSAFSTVQFEKALGKNLTTRSAKTIKRIAARIAEIAT